MSRKLNEIKYLSKTKENSNKESTIIQVHKCLLYFFSSAFSDLFYL